VPGSKANPSHASSVTLCRPLSYGLRAAPSKEDGRTLERPACRTLERGWQNPRKGYRHLFGAHTGRRRDIRPARHVSSVAISPVRPSPPLRHHPKHCSAILGALKPGTIRRCHIRRSATSSPLSAPPSEGPIRRPEGGGVNGSR
jgi:hypothetical protein